MSQTCERCYRIVDRACQSETEWSECPNLRRTERTLRNLRHGQASHSADARVFVCAGCGAEVHAYGDPDPTRTRCLMCQWIADHPDAPPEVVRVLHREKESET